MNKIIERVFKNGVFNSDKLTGYGFAKCGADYVYQTEILNGQFIVKIKIKQGDVSAEVIGCDTGEPYTLFLVDGADGSFVGKVRTEYERVLTEIADKCFDKIIFKGAAANAVIDYVRKTYGCELEFLWEKFSDNAVWRRKDNKKWFAILLTVPKNKLGLSSTERTEILDLRIKPEDIEKTVDGKVIFPGYHMNKKHWITVLLDGSAQYERVIELLNESYILANVRH